jgi:hypothetical protein
MSSALSVNAPAVCVGDMARGGVLVLVLLLTLPECVRAGSGGTGTANESRKWREHASVDGQRRESVDGRASSANEVPRLWRRSAVDTTRLWRSAANADWCRPGRSCAIGGASGSSAYAASAPTPARLPSSDGRGLNVDEGRMLGAAPTPTPPTTPEKAMLWRIAALAPAGVIELQSLDMRLSSATDQRGRSSLPRVRARRMNQNATSPPMTRIETSTAVAIEPGAKPLTKLETRWTNEVELTSIGFEATMKTSASICIAQSRPRRSPKAASRSAPRTVPEDREMEAQLYERPGDGTTKCAVVEPAHRVHHQVHAAAVHARGVRGRAPTRARRLTPSC